MSHINDKIWLIIDSYFKTVKKNLVSHQLDSYNMFVMQQIPKTIRQFNPMVLIYGSEPKKYTIEINVGGSVRKIGDEHEILNDGNGIFISKPVVNEKIGINEDGKIIYKNKIKQLYPNEARLKNLTYGVNIFVNVFITFNKIPMKFSINDSWEHISEPIETKKINLGFVPVMLGSKLCVLNEQSNTCLYNMGECMYDQGGYFIIDGKEKSLIAQERQVENKIYIKKLKDDLPYLIESEIRSSPENKFQPARITRVRCLRQKGRLDRGFLINEGTIRVLVPNIIGKNDFSANVPLFVLFRALGVTSDKEILQYILYDLDDPKNTKFMDILRNSVKDGYVVSNQKEAFKYLQNKIKPFVKEKKKLLEDSRELRTNIQKQQNKSLLSKLKRKDELEFVYIMDILQNYLFPHVGTEFIKKAYFLGHMVKKTLEVYLGYHEPTDRDSFIYKRVDLSGFLVGTIFRDLYFRFKNNVEHMINQGFSTTEKKITGKLELKNIINEKNINKIFSSLWIDEGFRFAFKNAWGLKHARGNKLGIVQDLNRLSFLGTISHLRRINTPLPKGAKIRAPHSLHGSSWGIICPIETPDGGNIGIRKNLSLLSHVTFGCNSQPIEKCLRLFSMLYFSEVEFKQINQYTKIFLNERLVGVHERPKFLTRCLKSLRRNALINIYTSIAWYIENKVIKISTDSGRSCRPIFIAENIKNKTKTEKLLLKLKNKEINWYNLICGDGENLSSTKKIIYEPYDFRFHFPNLLIKNIISINHDIVGSNGAISNSDLNRVLLDELIKTEGIIEYVDTEESNTSFIAMTPEQLDSKDKIFKYSHCEIHPTLIYGTLASIIPFSDSNQFPRNLFSTGQSKQAISIYTTNFKNRMDTEGQIIYYGEKPLIKTRYEKYLYGNKLPYGMNTIIAVACYSGYNQEDSIIVNKNSLDRGLFRTMIFKTYVERESKSEYTGLEELFKYNPKDTVIGRKTGNFSKLDKNGIIKEEAYVDENDIIISKVMNTGKRDKKNNLIYKDSSIFLKRTQKGYVDKVFLDKGDDGYKLCKIRIRKEKLPEIGDKFCSRHGQKGVIGMVMKQEDMPFTKNGITPDMIVNPHAFPSRMTIAQFMECVMGKASAELGIRSDSTPFTNIDKSKMCSLLEECGFEKHGNEVLYSGRTGRQLKVSIFIGPTFYLRLTHQVSKKAFSRSTGSNTTLVKQPLGGRAMGGGLRIGEMERDALISHGASIFLKESMLERADNYHVWTSNKSGLVSIANPKKNIYADFSSDKTKYLLKNNVPNKILSGVTDCEYFKIKLPYAFKLFLQELETMCVVPRFITENTINTWLKVRKDNLEKENEIIHKKKYYSEKGSKYTAPMRAFHNFVKSKLLSGSKPIKYDDRKISIFDMSVGIGGDLNKWFFNKFDEIYAMDLDKDNLGTRQDNENNTLWGRINQFGQDDDKKTHNLIEKSRWIKNTKFYVFDGDMSEDLSLKSKLRLNFLNIKVDIITIFFSIHYIFDDTRKIEQLFNNIKKYLKPNGYLLITTLDGNKVFQQLKDRESIKEIIQLDSGEEKILWKIKKTKEYLKNQKHLSNLPTDVSSLKFPVEISFETFAGDDSVQENLVSSEFLTNIARKYGLETVSNPELFKDFDKLVFYKGSDTFDVVYKNIMDNEIINKQSIITQLEKNVKLRKYSELNRYYIFKNRCDIDISFEKEKYQTNILLEPLNISHIKDLFDIVSNPLVMKKVGNGKIWDYDWTKKYVEENHFLWSKNVLEKQCYSWIVISIVDGVKKISGLIEWKKKNRGIKDDDENFPFSLRIFLSEKFQNKGLGTKSLQESLKQMMDYEPNEKIFLAQTHVSNVRSQKLLTKVGFTKKDDTFRIGNTPVQNFIYNKPKYPLDDFSMSSVLQLDFPYPKYFISLEQIYQNFKKLKEHKYIIDIKNLNKSSLIEIDYEKIKNIVRITDYFSNDCRIKCKFNGYKQSIYEYYSRNKENIIRNSLISGNFSIDKFEKYTFNLAKHSSKITKYCNNFYVTLALSIYRSFGAKKILDSSAGWGDRLIAALAYDECELYTGYDPSECLRPKYSNIIKTLKNHDVGKYEVFTQPFEEAIVEKKYDLAFSSPPFFDLEEYENHKNQSIQKFETETEWIKGFLNVLVYKNLENLYIGGHLVLYIPNYPFFNKFIKKLILENFIESRGTIRFKNINETKNREIFVWRKIKNFGTDDKINLLGREIAKQLEEQMSRRLDIQMGGGYKSMEECKLDLKTGERFVGQLLRNIVFASNNQTTIEEHIQLQREYNGSSYIVNKSDDLNHSKYEYLKKAIDKYSVIDQLSFENSFFVLYYLVKQGIFIKIKNNILVCFIVFINHSDKNIYELHDSVEDMLYEMDMTKENVRWIVDCHSVTEQSIEKYLSTSDYFIMKNLLLELLKNNEISDAEFFINPTSCPVLKHVDLSAIKEENKLKNLYKNMNIFLINNQIVKYRDKSAKIIKYSIKNDEIKYTLNIRGDIIEHVPFDELTLSNYDLFKGQYVNYHKSSDMVIPSVVVKINSDDEVTIKYIENCEFIEKTVEFEDIEVKREFKFMPIISSNTDEKNFYYNDICLPNIDDWRFAKLKEGDGIFPFKCQNEEFGTKGWDERKSIFIYRDYPYGNSVNGNENKKLNLAILSKYIPELDARVVKTDNELVIKNNKTNRLEHIPYEIDYVKDGKSIKIPQHSIFCKLKRDLDDYGKKNFIMFDNESYNDYKYVFFVDNNCPLYSYTKLLSTGALIIKIKNNSDSWSSLMCNYDEEQMVNSTYPWEDIDIEVSPIHNHVEIELDEIERLIKWCKTEKGDIVCSQLATNSKRKFVELITKDNLLNHWKTGINLISNHTNNNSLVKKTSKNSKKYVSENIFIKNDVIKYIKGSRNKRLNSIIKKYSTTVTVGHSNKDKIGYTKFEIDGNFTEDVRNTINELSQFNEIITTKIILPSKIIKKTSRSINLISIFIREKNNLIKYFNLLYIFIGDSYSKDIKWISGEKNLIEKSGNMFVHPNKDDKDDKDNSIVGGKEITIVGTKNNVKKCIDFIKMRLKKKFVKFSVPANKLLDEYPILEEFMDDSEMLDYGYRCQRIAIIVADLEESEELEELEEDKYYFIEQIKTIFLELNCKSVIDIYWIKQNTNLSNPNLHEKNKFTAEVITKDGTKFKKNKGGCFSAGFNILKTLEEKKYNKIIFHDYDFLIKSGLHRNKILSGTILSNHDIIHLTHHSNNENLDGIVIFKNSVITSTNNYPNYYWNMLDSSSELYKNCTKGLNWASGDFLFSVKRPIDIKSSFFEIHHQEKEISKETEWYEKNHKIYRNYLNTIDNVNKNFYVINSEKEIEIEDMIMESEVRLFLFDVSFTHLCNPYYYNLDDINKETKININKNGIFNLKKYVEKVFNRCLPGYEIQLDNSKISKENIFIQNIIKKKIYKKKDLNYLEETFKSSGFKIKEFLEELKDDLKDDFDKEVMFDLWKLSKSDDSMDNTNNISVKITNIKSDILDLIFKRIEIYGIMIKKNVQKIILENYDYNLKSDDSSISVLFFKTKKISKKLKIDDTHKKIDPDTDKHIGEIPPPDFEPKQQEKHDQDIDEPDKQDKQDKYKVGFIGKLTDTRYNQFIGQIATIQEIVDGPYPYIVVINTSEKDSGEVFSTNDDGIDKIKEQKGGNKSQSSLSQSQSSLSQNGYSIQEGSSLDESININDKVRYEGKRIRVELLGEGKVIGSNNDGTLTTEFGNKKFQIPIKQLKKIPKNTKVIGIKAKSQQINTYTNNTYDSSIDNMEHVRNFLSGKQKPDLDKNSEYISHEKKNEPSNKTDQKILKSLDKTFKIPDKKYGKTDFSLDKQSTIKHLDSNEKYSNEKYSDEKCSGEKYSNEKYSNEKYSNEKYSNEKYSDEKYSDEKCSNEKCSDEKCSNEKYSEQTKKNRGILKIQPLEIANQEQDYIDSVQKDIDEISTISI